MKIISIAAGVVALLIAGVVVFLLTFDVGQYKGLIQDQAKAAIGREVSVGSISLELALNPAIVVTDIKVANAPWGGRAEMLTLKRVEASTQLIPLLFGTVNISGLKLVEPDAVLETNGQGKGNWEFDVPPSEGGGVPINVNGIEVEGLKLLYRDGQTRGSASVAAKAVEAEIDGDLLAMTVPSISLSEAVASYKQGNLAAEGNIGELELETVGPITDVNIRSLKLSKAKGSYKDGPTAYEGAVDSLAMEGDGKARPPAKGIDIAAALQALTVTSLTMDTATAAMKDPEANASATIGKVQMTAAGKIADLGITNLSVTNTKANYQGGGGAPFDVVIDKLSLNDKGALDVAGKLSGQDVKASGTLAPIATLVAMNKSFPAKLALEGMGLKADADLTVDMSGKRPVAKGTFAVPELDLAALTGASAAPAAKPAAPPPGGKMFSKDPLPWDSLTSADANVKVSLGKLTLPSGVMLTDVVLPVNLANGRLAMRPASFAVAGGTIAADVTMNAGDRSVALKAEGKGFTAENLAKAFKRTDLITQGPVDINIDVRGNGESVSDIAASLDGSIVGGMGESRIRSGALNIMGADVIMQVISVVNPMGNKDPYTVARCGVVNFQITDGIANTNSGIALVTDKMQLTSSGKIDLRAEQVDLNVRPKATGGIGIGLGSLVQAVKVAGPLSGPGVKADKAGTIKAIGTLGAAFATGGASLLAQSAADKVTADGDPCKTAREWHLRK